MQALRVLRAARAAQADLPRPVDLASRTDTEVRLAPLDKGLGHRQPLPFKDRHQDVRALARAFVKRTLVDPADQDRRQDPSRHGTGAQAESEGFLRNPLQLDEGGRHERDRGARQEQRRAVAPKDKRDPVAREGIFHDHYGCHAQRVHQPVLPPVDGLRGVHDVGHQDEPRWRQRLGTEQGVQERLGRRQVLVELEGVALLRGLGQARSAMIKVATTPATISSI